MPDNKREGMLEDLCLESVQDDDAFPCLGQYFDCLKTQGKVPKSLPKARIHAWLASQEEPDRRLGEAAQKGYWPFDHEAFKPITEFIKML